MFVLQVGDLFWRDFLNDEKTMQWPWTRNLALAERFDEKVAQDIQKYWATHHHAGPRTDKNGIKHETATQLASVCPYDAKVLAEDALVGDRI